MKRGFTIALIIVATALLSRCKKVWDYIEQNPNADIKECPILKMVYSPSCKVTPDTLIFTYNSWGDPATAKRSCTSTGLPDYIFKYDSKRRLTEYLGVYRNYYNDGVSMESWHKYFYDGTGRVVLDSNYVWPAFKNGVIIDFYWAGLTYYTYDSKGRIIKDSMVATNGYVAGPPYQPGFTVVNNYAYDASGNRTGRTYDQKTSFLRTNKIWMFLNRDYSLNNPFPAQTYNSTGLPGKYNLSKTTFYVKFLVNDFYDGEIVYGCK